MDAKELFKAAAKSAHSCVSRVEQAQLGRATPCSNWDLHALLRHMVNELAWIPDLLAGKTITEVGNGHDGDLLGSNALAAWRQMLEHALSAVEIADLQAAVHLSYGDFPAEHYIRETGTDILIHGWDVGQAIGCSVVFDEKLAQTVYNFVGPRAEEFKQSGLFGTPLPTKETDSIQTKLLAFFGRQKRWQSPG